MFKNTLTIIILSSFFACSNEKTSNTSADTKAVADATANFIIEGMTCQVGCAAYIDKALEEMSGILSSDVDYESKTAVVKYDNSLISEYAMMDLINTMKDSAYEVTSVEVEIITSLEKNKIDTH